MSDSFIVSVLLFFAMDDVHLYFLCVKQKHHGCGKNTENPATDMVIGLQYPSVDEAFHCKR